MEKNPEIIDIMKKGILYLESKKAKNPKSKRNSLWFIDEQNKIKLGASGISLLAYVSYLEVTGDN